MLIVGNGGALAYLWFVEWLLAATESYTAGFVSVSATVIAV